MEAAELTPKRIWQLETGRDHRAGKSDHRQLLASSPFGHVSAAPDSSQQHGAVCAAPKNGTAQIGFVEGVDGNEHFESRSAPSRILLVLDTRRRPSCQGVALGVRRTRHAVLAPRENLGAYRARS